ncbi:hypothetical protein BSAF29S_06120 [Bacillus safensis subsp. safensis]
MNIQDMISTLKHWSNEGCVLMQAYDTKGAGTMSPYTFLRALAQSRGGSVYSLQDARLWQIWRKPK